MAHEPHIAAAMAAALACRPVLACCCEQRLRHWPETSLLSSPKQVAHTPHAPARQSFPQALVV